MKNGKTENKTKQRTKQGLEIPVPRRGEFMKNLKKAAKSPARRPKK